MSQGTTVTQLKEVGHQLTPFDKKKVGGIFFEQPDHTLFDTILAGFRPTLPLGRPCSPEKWEGEVVISNEIGEGQWNISGGPADILRVQGKKFRGF